AVRSDRRDVFYYEGSLEDITERKRTEEELRLHAAMMDNVAEGVYLIGLDGLLIKWTNERFTRMFGYDPGEMVEKQVDIVNAPTERTPTETRISIVDVLKETGEWHGEVRNIKRDGTHFWCYANVSLFDHPEYGKVIVSVHTDITERKRAEQGLSKERTLLKAIVDKIPVLLTRYEPDTNMLYLNKEFEKIVGWKTEEVKDIDLMEKVYPDPDYRKQAMEYMQEASTEWREFRVQSKSGKIVNSEWSNIRLDDGTQVGIGIDITERKRVEKQLRQQGRLAAVGQLAAGIAHDFNNTMASIILYAQMMLRASDLSSRDRERLGTINQEARHAADLTQQILDFSRRSVLERRPLDLLPFLKELSKLLESTLPENIKIVLAYGPDEYTVNADPTRIQQAMMNLALNARDAMPEGGELHIGLERIRVEDGQETVLPEMEAGEWVQVTVADTGTGIPPDALPHMFEPFFTTKPVGQGTGLGLAQVYGIVKQHGGEIDVESELGHGVTFVIYLPALPVSAPEALPREIPALAEGHGETILVVEDNPGAREALSDTLEMLNYRVLAAANGQEALEIYRSAAAARPATASTSTASTTASTRGGARGRRGGERSRRIDLVLTDIVMPGMGGRELMRELRKIDPHLKGLGVTGYAVKEDLREEGIVDVLRKPFDVGALAEVVRHALDAD
ncbi:MAG: PAS domain S-box protein, partial [Anaerolineae bacterium]